MNVDDTIKCYNSIDAVKTMLKLSKSGIETDVLYEKDGTKGLWLKVISVEQRNEEI